MKLKLDDAGHVVVADGKPVYVHDDGKEIPFDAPAALNKLADLGRENKGFREAKEAAETKLKVFEGLDDPAAAKAALETVKNLDAGKLVEAGKVEEIKKAAVKAYEEQAAAAAKAHATEVKRLTTQHENLLATYNGEKIAGAFKGSKFIADKFAIPADLVEARFGNNFKVEDGKIVAYDSTGNKLFSRAKPGDVAEFDEAIEMLVDAYPYRDHVLKGANGAGSGKSPNSGSNGAGRTMTRAAFEALGATERMAFVKENGTIAG